MDNKEKSFFPHPEGASLQPPPELELNVTGLGIMVDHYMMRATKANKEERTQILGQITTKRAVFDEALKSDEYAMLVVSMLNSILRLSVKHAPVREFAIEVVGDHFEDIEKNISEEDLERSTVCFDVLYRGLFNKKEELNRFALRNTALAHMLYENDNWKAHSILIDSPEISTAMDPPVDKFLGNIIRSNPELKPKALRDLLILNGNGNVDISNELFNCRREIFEGFLSEKIDDYIPYRKTLQVMFFSDDPRMASEAEVLLDARILSLSPQDALRVLSDLTLSRNRQSLKKYYEYLHKWRDIIIEYSNDPDASKNFHFFDLIHQPCFRNDRQMQDLRHKIAMERYRDGADMLTSLGLNSEEFFTTWAECSPERSIFNINIRVIEILERKEPGIVKSLRDNYGIVNFARYPQDLLLKQYREKENNKTPYGVLIYPLTDWNGAFSEGSAITSLLPQLGDNFMLRAAEAGGRYSLAKTLRRMYKEHGKITFAIIGGHGNPYSVQFGSPESYNFLSIQDLWGEGAAKMEEVFSKDPTIILESCSTGRLTGGIAATLSILYGATVIAPNVDTSIRSINVQMDENGKPVFDVAYRNEGEEMRYVNGDKG